MKLPVLLLALAGALVPALPVHAQEAAGRVILATGSVAIVRGAQKIPASVGVPLRAGDTIELGAQSHAQLYMTDDSIISLRPETTFRIREYSFDGKDPEAGRSFFDLVKGGMRTVTGLIKSRDRYRVSTETVSIGIRGTHYWLVSCSQSCRNADGSLGEDGDYGLVREGSVAISTTGTQTGSVFGTDQIMPVAAEPQVQREFASDQVFRVARGSGQIQQLIGPPSFLFTQIGGLQPIGAPPGTPGDTTAKPKVAPQVVPTISTVTAPLPLPTTGQRGEGAGDTRVTSTITNNTNFTFANVKQQSVTVSPPVEPALQAGSALSVAGPASVIEPTFTGTVFYRLAGTNLNIPASCNDPPCSNVSRGQIVLGVNLALQRATVRADLEFGSGDIINFGTPSAISGIPVTINGDKITFAGTLNRADFPQNNGAFRCSQCGPASPPSFSNGTPGFADQISFSGTISGGVATVTLSAVDSSGGGGSLTATLSPVTPPNNAVAAMAIQRLDGGTDARSNAFWNVQVDSSGRLVQFGPNDGVNSFGNHVGGPSARVGSATNTILGTAPGAGNLVWGTWTGPGAQFIDSNYDSFSSTSSGRLSVQPWITGEAPNTLPPSLGVQTYMPILTPTGAFAAAFTNNQQVLNAASMTADFVNRKLDLFIDATNTNGGNRYQMRGSTGFSPTSSQFSAGFQTVTCTGPCNTGSNFRTPSGSYGGIFAGQQAQGAGVVFTAGFGAQAVNGNAGNGVTGVIPMTR